ncbi:MAG: hypothetical protein RsTaC01_0344 [Candidatus Paraimprobicoccus trichonymphae]|uniref:Uncharacterized protein n=1 Tax=Candidatus Paraimprobicoccus trichonymphae TaxID=3033793 RepID=A0AA48IBR1_9FIRM|nr:MAG: hypothetical protein RsTaC01_0344 [Candidatus Paraimprobicoccus trichonymphae]
MSKMMCPKCGSNDVNITSEKVGSKTKKKRMGILFIIVRAFLVFITFGLWLLIGERSGSEKTTYKYQTIALCQKCANRWKVKKKFLIIKPSFSTYSMLY